ncbi:MAG: hypothetical protein HQL38_07955 [Alphaproteobacteria bacterium]|nr:hypothetical protein [Alphaproteobacteria bacterium]
MRAHDRAAARDAGIRRYLDRKVLADEIAGMEVCLADWRQRQADAVEDGELGLACRIGEQIIEAQNHINDLRRKLANMN